ncbi:MAG: hypothetical protein ABJB10_00820 [Mesorhizobium sp.]
MAASDKAVERWLREEVALTMDDARAHPDKLLTAEQVRRNLSDHINAIIAKSLTGA